MLLSLSEKAAYAASANLTVLFQPGTCGPATINGTAYPNGSVAHLAPSSTPYLFTLASCSGHSFQNWYFTGGVHLSSAGHLLISSSGSFRVVYS